MMCIIWSKPARQKAASLLRLELQSHQTYYFRIRSRLSCFSAISARPPRPRLLILNLKANPEAAFDGLGKTGRFGRVSDL